MTEDTDTHDDPADDTGTGTDDLEQTVETFLDDVDATLAEYDQGYADADATLTILRTHLSTLREDVED
jgi:hypothetical protein